MPEVKAFYRRSSNRHQRRRQQRMRPRPARPVARRGGRRVRDIALIGGAVLLVAGFAAGRLLS